jgi:hypothetical protein
VTGQFNKKQKAASYTFARQMDKTMREPGTGVVVSKKSKCPVQKHTLR